MIESIPGAQFVLELVAIGTVLATASAYRRRKQVPDLDVAKEVASASVAFLAIATVIQFVALVT